MLFRSLKREVPKFSESQLRPSVKMLLNKTARSGTGSHQFKVTMTSQELAVVEEFMRDLEKGTGGEGKSAWGGREIAMRLYSIVVGYRERGVEPAL